MTKKDLILVLSLLIIVLAGYAFIHFAQLGQQAVAAEISLDGQAVQRIDLEKAGPLKEYSVLGPLGTTVIQARQGEARIIASPCRDKVCIRMGWVKLPGQSAICIPNRVILSIVSEDNPIDSIAR